MTRERKLLWVKTATVLCVVPVLLYAFSSGPPPRRTGAPGDRTCIDSGCHVGTTIQNSDAIALTSSTGDLTYTPGGSRQRWTLRITDSQARRFGFQLTARLASNETNGQAGDLNPADTATQVICENDQPKPAAGCPANAPVQFVEHFQFPRTDGTFTFDWTPPATNVGDVRVYVAANGSVAGVGASRIHLRNFTIRPAASTNPSPSIRAEQPVLQAFDDRGRLSPGTYVQVFGSNFAQNGPNGRLWEGRDFSGNNAPTNLDGWGVTFNDVPGFVYFVRGGVPGAPDQINVQVPNIPTTGNVSIVVTGPGGLRSNVAALPAAPASPAVLAPAGFRVNNVQYAAANFAADLNAGRVVYVGRAGLVPGAEFRPARPGDTIIVYAVGCGPVTPEIRPGQIATVASRLSLPFTIRLGGQAIQPVYAGLYGGFVGLYRFDITVPDLPNGDHRLELAVDGIAAQESFLTVQR